MEMNSIMIDLLVALVILAIVIIYTWVTNVRIRKVKEGEFIQEVNIFPLGVVLVFPNRYNKIVDYKFQREFERDVLDGYGALNGMLNLWITYNNPFYSSRIWNKSNKFVPAVFKEKGEFLEHMLPNPKFICYYLLRLALLSHELDRKGKLKDVKHLIIDINSVLSNKYVKSAISDYNRRLIIANLIKAQILKDYPLLRWMVLDLDYLIDTKIEHRLSDKDELVYRQASQDDEISKMLSVSLNAFDLPEQFKGDVSKALFMIFVTTTTDWNWWGWVEDETPTPLYHVSLENK